MKMIFRLATLVAIAAVSVAPALADGLVKSFGKASIRAQDGAGQMVMLEAKDFQFPLKITGDKPTQKLVQIKKGGDVFWVRVRDVETERYGSKEEVPCLTGEVHVATNDKQLGATQMGAGLSKCAQTEAAQ